MCLIAFAFNVRTDYPLLLVANRDEFHDRAAAPMDWWDDAPDVLAGRDLREQGTWLGVSRSGRAAAVTNVRLPADMNRHHSLSRGKLISDYLRGALGAHEFAASLEADASKFGAFNLLLYQPGALLYVRNVPNFSCTEVSAGVHALSNAQLDVPWPKACAVQQAMEQWLATDLSDEASLLSSMHSDARPPDGQLPDTGVGLEMERMLSPAFIRTPTYGTRCTSVLRIGADHQISLREIRFNADGQRSGERREIFVASA